MPTDDEPIDALEHQFEMEDLSVSPVGKAIVSAAGKLPLIWPLDKIVEGLKDHLAVDSWERTRLLVETLATELRKKSKEIKNLQERMTAVELQSRQETLLELVLDGAHKAENTRAKERVKRIGLILANGTLQSTNSDAIEEMMRVAMELSDHDIEYLQELVRIQGPILQRDAHISRYDAHQSWENGLWGNSVDPEVDSVFSKLQSYGLVSRIPPPNNLNITADFQNRYVLLKKGAWFAALIQESPAIEPDQ